MEKVRVYNGNSNLKLSGERVPISQFEVEEYYKCFTDFEYFANNYCKIISLDEGLVNFNLYDYQKQVAKCIRDNRFSIHVLARQMGKSILVAAKVVWYAIFNENQHAAILANKMMIAREIFSRIMVILENLPFWMQPGVKSANKSEVWLGNGSKIFASATTPSAVRGKSLTCLTGENEVDILFEGKIFTVSLETLSNIDCNGMKILSQGEFRKFSHVEEMGIKDVCKVVFNDGSEVNSTRDHEFLTKAGWKQVQEFSRGEDLFSKQVKEVIFTGEKQTVYDVIDVKDTHSFTVNGVEAHNCLVIDEAAFVPNWEEFWTSVFPTISAGSTTKVILTSTPNSMNDFYYLFSDAVAGDNGFAHTFFDWRANPTRDEAWADAMIGKLGKRKFDQEFNCAFFGSSGTLVDGDALERLATNKKQHVAEKYDGHFRITEPVMKDAHYVAIVDTAEGLGADSSTLTIIKISSVRPKVVAYYKNNSIEIEPFAEVCNNLGLLYNEALMLVENNSIGRLTVSKLWDTWCYPNMLRTSTGDGETKVNGKGSRPGVRTTTLTKAIGCSTLKSLIESGELEVEQTTIINELTTFVRVGRSFEAMKGRNDDLVMTLVLFAWLTTTQWYFSYRNSIVDFSAEPEGDLEVTKA